MASRYYVYLPKSVLKSMAKIPLPWRGRIQETIDMLQMDPYYGKKMLGQYANKRKIRVWPYRIIYSIEEENRIVKIFEVEHRGHVSYD